MAKNKGKWIGSNEIDGSKIRLNNDQPLRGRNSTDSADISIGKVNASNDFEFVAEPTFNGSPTKATSLVNRQFVLDSLAGIRDLKDAVRVATTTALSASAAGTKKGKTLTALANGVLVVDGVTLENGDRVGVLNNNADNGIYVVTDAGSVSTPWVLTRATDADDSPEGEVTQGMSFDVVEGTANGKTRWLLTTKNIVLDTTPLVFVKTPVLSDIVNFNEEAFVITAQNLIDGYVELGQAIINNSITVWPVGGPLQTKDTDFTLSKPASVTRVTFAGDLTSTLEEGDKLIVKYAYLVAAP